MLVCEKSPLTFTPVKLNGVVPIFARTRFCAVLAVPTNCAAKVRLAGDTCAVKPTPVPLRLTVCAPLEAEEVIDKVPVRAPVWVGVK